MSDQCEDCGGTRTMGCNASPSPVLCESCYLHRKIATARAKGRREGLEEAARLAEKVGNDYLAAAIRALARGEQGE